jgi:uncharacterized protein (DUF1684 family)
VDGRHRAEKLARRAVGRYGIAVARLAACSFVALCAAAGGTIPLNADDLLKERERTLQSFRDPKRSPLAAVARHDFDGDKPLLLGGAPDDDVQLEGVAPHAAKLRALPAGFELSRDGKTERLPPGARVELGRFTLRLSHQNFPAAVVLDRLSPALKTGPFPVWFDPDPSARVEARLVPEAAPREEIVLSTRGNKRRAQRLGQLHFTLQGKPQKLTALRLLEPGTGESAVSIFFRDATTGHESYPVGRYVDAEPLDGDRYVLDFNRAYNPSCAFSPLYNCPIPPRENVLAAAVRAGERDPAPH